VVTVVMKLLDRGRQRLVAARKERCDDDAREGEDGGKGATATAGASSASKRWCRLSKSGTDNARPRMKKSTWPKPRCTAVNPELLRIDS